MRDDVEAAISLIGDKLHQESMKPISDTSLRELERLIASLKAKLEMARMALSRGGL